MHILHSHVFVLKQNYSCFKIIQCVLCHCFTMCRVVEPVYQLGSDSVTQQSHPVS